VSDAPPTVHPEGLAGPDPLDEDHADSPWGAGPPPELTAAITDTLIEAVAGVRTPLDAELALCHAFGPVELGVEGDEAERLQALIVLLSSVIRRAERVATADALALLRACAAIGPDLGRQTAALAASQVAAGGVPDRPWANRIGRPTVLRAWRYGDVFGDQASVGVLFDYQGREHALMVLIDHQLGGGIKDCWVAEGRDARAMRTTLATQLAGEPGVVFEDVETATAANLLRDALACPPCPEQDDQIEDVAIHLYLVRSRTELLCELAGLPAPDQPEIGGEQQDPTEGEPVGEALVLRLKVSLTGIRPPVWRRIEVPARITLDALHRILQAAFGWTDSHLHCFEVPSGGRRGDGRILEGAVLRRTRLDSVADGPGDRLVYRYDFGDDWIHRIEVEDRLPADPTVDYPRCTGGRRAAPPEDCGGVPGYELLLEALADPEHPEHDELSAWVPEGFDPARFDRAAVDHQLRIEG
jgi:hypothetical protein